ARLDSVDNNQNFVGAWVTFRPDKGRAIDAYYLVLDNTSRVVQQGVDRGNFTRHTLGGRDSGDGGGCLWDLEAAVQPGRQGGDGGEGWRGEGGGCGRRVRARGGRVSLGGNGVVPDHLGVLRLRQRGQHAERRHRYHVQPAVRVWSLLPGVARPGREAEHP